jgi:PST family polysaccharide transporter
VKPEPEPVPPPSDIEHRFAHSSAAGVAIQVSRAVFDFGGRMVLNRMLLPGERGVYELGIMVLSVAAVLRDLGLPQQMLRDPRRPFGTLLRSSAVFGASIAAGLVLLAPLLGRVFAEHPGFPEVLRVFAVWILIDGLVAVPRAYFERELRVGRLVFPEALRAAVAAAVAIALAARGAGVWSLVWGDLVAAVVLCGFLWWRARRQIPFVGGWELLPDLVRKSRPLFLVGLGYLFLTRIDQIIVGRYENATVFGHYSQCWTLVFLTAIFAWPRALVPALVAQLDRRDAFAATFRIASVQLLGVQSLASWFLATNAPQSLTLVYGAEWRVAAPLLLALSFVPMFDWYGWLIGEVFRARHEDRLWLVGIGVDLLTLLIAGIFLTRRYGAVGMAMANYLPLGRLWLFGRLRRVLGERARAYYTDVAWLALAPAPLFLLVAWLFPEPDWRRFAASLLAAGLAAGLLAYRFRDVVRVFLRAMGRSHGSHGSHGRGPAAAG